MIIDDKGTARAQLHKNVCTSLNIPGTFFVLLSRDRASCYGPMHPGHVTEACHTLVSAEDSGAGWPGV